ncbi:MAG: dihydroorotate dehydrogenase electron transfer subunit [Oscillospiraceae bacterium]|nr:dihydroorotate dehydrogenase electron transfer subunit [Oscillospiraceae bacterium]
MADLFDCIISTKQTFGGCTELVLQNGALAACAAQGQFLHIQCGDQTLRRPISICDVAGDSLTVVFEVKGAGTEWLAAQQVGAVVNVLGPLGHGFPLVCGRILVCGGGIGVPPMLLTAKGAEAADAVLGFRTASREMLTDRFRAVCTDVVVMSDDGTCGKQGFVADGAAELLKKHTYAAVMACGPKIMLKTVAQAAKKAGVPCYVSMEERMGCGIGACLVCACKTTKNGEEGYRHVCKDGPVFAAEEVCWDD